MKTLALLLALLATAAFAGDIQVLARLVEQPYKIKNDPLYKPVYIFKYKVIKVEKGKVSAKEILVGQYNPAVARNQITDKMKDKVKGSLKAFKAGETHGLVLSGPLDKIWKDAVEDEYFDDSSVRYFAEQTDPAK